MIRVLRLMEYEYKDYEEMEADMSHWGVPANGVVTHGTKKVRSAIIPSFEKDSDDDA